jgi:aspartate kinase
MKFGGTSVKNSDAFRNVASIIKRNLDKKPLIVLSAMAGVTNILEESVQNAVNQLKEDVNSAVDKLKAIHQNAVSDLFSEYSDKKTALDKIINSEMKKLEALLSATGTIKIESTDLSHAILSIGEIISSSIMTSLLQTMDIPSKFIDARGILITTNHNNEIVPVPEIIETEAQKYILPQIQKGKIVVTQGFIGATSEGAPTTLGRNGSDFSAALLGAALKVDEIQIWTDVDGILTADPTIIKSARPLELMTFDEACELAYFGARVLYPSAIQPALEKDIPVRVLNSSQPESQGTLIVNRSEYRYKSLVKSIAYKEGITLLTVKSTQLLLSTKLLSELFYFLTKRGMRVYAVSKSAIKLSLTVENNTKLEKILEEFHFAGKLKIEHNKAIVSIVGENMKRNPDISWEVIKMLKEAQINIELISQFAGQISFMFIIDEKDIDKTVKLLHTNYIESEWK